MNNKKYIIFAVVTILLTSALLAITILTKNKAYAVDQDNCVHKWKCWIEYHECELCEKRESCSKYTEQYYTYDNAQKHWTTRCSVCHGALGYPEDHVDSNSDGICDKCLYEMGGCDHDWQPGTGSHTCSKCGITEGCEFVTHYAQYSDERHWTTWCPKCHSVQGTEEHIDINKDGICDKCFEVLSSEPPCEHQWKCRIEYHECLLCGETESCSKYTEIYYTYYNEQKHWTTRCAVCHGALGLPEDHIDRNSDGVCDRCNHSIETECTHPSSSVIWKSDSNGHWQYCNDCKQDISSKTGHEDEDENLICDICDYQIDCPHPTSYVVWKSDSNGHWKYCNKCKQDISSKTGHEDEDENLICDICDYPIDCPHPASYVVWKSDSNGHWQYCNKCKHDISSKTGHEDEDENLICDKCDYKMDCPHLQKYIRWESTIEEHWQRCNKCGEKLTQNEQHRFNNGKCDQCGYECEHPVTLIEWQSDSEGHWKYCNKCRKGITSKEEHKDKDSDAKCDYCQYAMACPHPQAKWEMKYNRQSHWPHCTQCDTDLTPKEDHVFTGEFVEGDTWPNSYHMKKCITCDYSEKEKCTPVLVINSTEHYYKCKLCTKTTDKHSNSNYIICNDSKNHWKQCEICNEIISSPEEHYVNDVLFYDNTYHYNKCDSCNYTKNQETHSINAKKIGNNVLKENCTKCEWAKTTYLSGVQSIDNINMKIISNENGSKTVVTEYLDETGKVINIGKEEVDSNVASVKIEQATNTNGEKVFVKKYLDANGKVLKEETEIADQKMVTTKDEDGNVKYFTVNSNNGNIIKVIDENGAVLSGASGNIEIETSSVEKQEETKQEDTKKEETKQQQTQQATQKQNTTQTQNTAKQQQTTNTVQATKLPATGQKTVIVTFTILTAISISSLGIIGLSKYRGV